MPHNAASGSFLSVDPFAGYAQQPLSLHAYQYGYNSPLVHADPSGRHPDPAKGKITGPEGTVIGMLVAMHYQSTMPHKAIFEFEVIKGSKNNPNNNGFADIVVPALGEAYEVKPEDRYEEGFKELGNYIEKLNKYHLHQSEKGLWDRGETYLAHNEQAIISLWPVGVDPKYNNPSKDGYFLIIARMVDGVVLYRSHKIEQPGDERKYAYDPKKVDEFARSVYQPWRYRKNFPKVLPQPLPVPVMSPLPPASEPWLNLRPLGDWLDKYGPVIPCVGIGVGIGMAIRGGGGGMNPALLR